MTNDDLRTGLSRRDFLIFSGAAAGTLVLANKAAAQAANSTLRYGLTLYPSKISPWESTGTADATVRWTLMRGLTGYNSKAELVGELAESWEMPDPLTWIFHLRQNAVFHDGSPVTSTDVVSTFERIKAEGSTATIKSNLAVVDAVTAVDDKTVQFKLNTPCPTLLNLLAFSNCPVISANSTPEAPISAGPFRLSSEERGVYVEVERFPDFYEPGQPKLEKIRFIAYPDDNLRFAALQTGDVDLIEYLPYANFQDVEASEDLVGQYTQGPYMYLMFNTTEGSPFADPRVRHAVGYAIQRQDVIDAAFQGYAEPILGLPNPEGSPFNLDMTGYQWTYDPEKAKALLAEAGYPNGFDCTLLASSSYAAHQDTASIAQAHLQAVGINAKLLLPEWSQRITAGNEGQYDLAIHGSGGFFNDLDAMYSLLYADGKPSPYRGFNFVSERINGLMKAGRTETDHAKRQEIYQELAEAYFEEVAQVPICFRRQGFAMNKSVKGFQALPAFLFGSSPLTLDETEFG